MVSFNPPQFNDNEYSAAKMRRLVDEIETLHQAVESGDGGSVIARVTSTPYTAGAERIILVDDDAIGGPVTIVLGNVAALSNRLYYIKKIGGTAPVTINPAGSELIDGTLTKILTTQYDSVTIASDGSDWWIL